MKLPSLDTLATLAAAMSSENEPPETTVSRALTLWKACRDSLNEESRLEELKRFSAEEIKKLELFTATFSTKEHWSRDEFLRVVMPDSKPGDRLAKYRSYWEELLFTQFEGAALEKAIEDEVREARANGFSAKSAPMEALQFCDFLKREGKYLATEKAKKGAAAKISLAAAKKADPAQANRKLPEAER